jgi:hypothetical protein
MRSITKIAAIVVLLGAVGAAQAEMRLGDDAGAHAMEARPAVSVARSAPMFANQFAATALLTLPPEDKPKTHWPWWLRILAVIGVLVFIRLVAGSVRNKPTGPPPV